MRASLTPNVVNPTELVGKPVHVKFNKAPGNRSAARGKIVVAENGWFVDRPSHTEDIYQIYSERFKGTTSIEAIQKEV